MNEIIQVKSKNIPNVFNEAEIRSLIDRVTGNKKCSDKFEFKQIPEKQKGYESFTMSDIGDKILIEATNSIAACVAFNYYLKEKCGCYYGPLTRQMNMPENLPAVGEKIEQSTVFLYRYFLNYCTFGYTTLFWKWEKYEALTDWMLMAGINLVLNPIGHEIVWQDTLMNLGYSQRDIDNFICGPAYFPWQWMMNMTKFGGDLPNWWYDEQVILSNKFSNKLRSFGAQVVLPGYCGMVPLDFEEKFKDSHPIRQGLWCKGFERPSILLPQDKMFDKVADLFYHTTKKYFGDNCYFSTDPFHEGGITDGIDLTKYGVDILNKMRMHNPDSVWFLQGWGDNPKREMLKALDKKDVIIGNIGADKNFNAGDDFIGYPWIYCNTGNFGGKRMISGNASGFLTTPFCVVSQQPPNSIVGVGMMMEGIECDEILFDIFSYISFKSSSTSDEDYLKSFLKYRYGKLTSNSLEAYKFFMKHIITKLGDNVFGARESSLCSRPGLDVTTVSWWGSESLLYDNNILIEIATLLLEDYEIFKENEGYRLDLTDIIRQCVANKSWIILDKMIQSFKKQDVKGFEKYSSIYLQFFDLQEALLATNKRMLLGSWVKQAHDYGKTVTDKRMFVFNAKALITTWGNKPGAVELRDYAHKEWAGMMSDFYKMRWDSFITQMSMYINRPDEMPVIDWYEFENVFALSNKQYKAEPKGNLKECALACMEFLKEL